MKKTTKKTTKKVELVNVTTLDKAEAELANMTLDEVISKMHATIGSGKLAPDGVLLEIKAAAALADKLESACGLIEKIQIEAAAIHELGSCTEIKDILNSAKAAYEQAQAKYDFLWRKLYKMMA